VRNERTLACFDLRQWPRVAVCWSDQTSSAAATDERRVEYQDDGTSPVAWRDVNLIGNFDFTTSSSPVDIDALAAHYENEDFWRRSMQEGEDDSPESSVNAN
jgi:hypothetical protein